MGSGGLHHLRSQAAVWSLVARTLWNASEPRIRYSSLHKHNHCINSTWSCYSCPFFCNYHVWHARQIRMRFMRNSNRSFQLSSPGQTCCHVKYSMKTGKLEFGNVTKSKNWNSIKYTSNRKIKELKFNLSRQNYSHQNWNLQCLSSWPARIQVLQLALSTERSAPASTTPWRRAHSNLWDRKSTRLNSSH